MSGTSAATSRASRSKVLETITDVFGSYSGHSRRSHATSGSPLRARARGTTSALQATELSRLGEMWKQAQREAKDKERELARTRARLLREERRAAAGAGRRGTAGGEVVEAAVTDALAVRQQARDLESQLDAVQAENAELRTNYDEALTKLGESLRVLEERALTSATVSDSARELAAAVDTLEGEKSAILNTSMANLRAYEEDAMQKDRALASARDAQAAAEDAVRTLRAQLDGTGQQLKLAQEAAARHEAAAVAARAVAVNAKEELTDMGRVVLDTKALKTQVRHLRVDNSRLVRLLATSKEYKGFADYTFAPDGDLPSGLTKGTYLGLIPRRGSVEEEEFLGGPPSAGGAAPSTDLVAGDRAAWRDIEAYERHYGVDDSQAVEPGREHEMWVPSDALRLTIQFRRKHLAHLPTSVIRGFLQNLNGVWRRRYAKQVSNLKAKHAAVVADLKRQLKQRVPYREVLQASTIQRLHSQLDTVRMASGGGVVVADHITGLATAAGRLSRTAGLARDDASVTRSPRKRSSRRSSSAARQRRSQPVAVHGETAAAPWSDTLTFDFPASADGGGGHGSGWTRKQEAKAVMNHALATVDALSRQVARLKEENAGLRAGAGERNLTADDLAEAQREAHTAGATQVGRQTQRLIEAAADAVMAKATELRRLLIDSKVAGVAGDGPSGLSPDVYAAAVAAIGEVEREVGALRSSTRQVFEGALGGVGGGAVAPPPIPPHTSSAPAEHMTPAQATRAPGVSPASVRWAMYGSTRSTGGGGTADGETDVEGW